MKSIQGFKTYILMVVGVIATGCLAMGYITQEQFNVVASLIGALGLGTLRSAINKV